MNTSTDLTKTDVTTQSNNNTHAKAIKWLRNTHDVMNDKRNTSVSFMMAETNHIYTTIIMLL